MREGWLFSLWLAAGLAVGVGVAFWQARRLALPQNQVAGAVMSLLGGGALGAKVSGWLLAGLGAGVQALVYAPLSAEGALIGAVIVLAGWGRRRRGAWAVADALLPGILAGAGILWLGAFQQGIAYGLPYDGAGALFAPDAHGLAMARWPVQVVGAGVCLVLALVSGLLLPRRVMPDGVLALVSGWLLLLLLVGLDTWRGDPAVLLGPFRVEQLGYLVALTLVALALPQRWRQSQREAAQG